MSHPTTNPEEDDSEHLYDVAIVGAGIAGMATALGLVHRGVTNIIVLEKATQLTPVGASIAMFSNGLAALRYLSPTVSEKVMKSCIPIDKMIVKDLEGNVIREKKPPITTVNYMVWYLLQQYLAEELPDGVLQLGHTVESFEIDESTGIVTITASSTIRNDDDDDNSNKKISSSPSNTNKIRARVLVGTDGIHSPIRRQLFGEGATKKFYHGKVSYRTVLSAADLINNNCNTKQNNPPPPTTGVNITFQGDEPGKLFSYRETSPGILTITSFARCDAAAAANDVFATTSNDNESTKKKKQKMVALFETYPEEVQNLLDCVSESSIHVDPIHDIDVLERWSKGPVILIGDAAHAMSPSMGQGANIGLEDASVLVHGIVKALLLLSSSSSSNQQDESTASSSSASRIIAACLEQVWRSRIDRVQRIHAASRTRSMDNNQSTKSTPVDMHSEQLQAILSEIDSWQAPPPLVD